MTTQEATHAPADTGEETAPFEVEPQVVPFEDALSQQTFEVMPLEDAPLPLSLEDTTPLTLPAPAPEPAHRVNTAAPDPFAVGVRLLRMAPVWLLLTTFGCAMLVFVLGWLKAGGDASAVTLAAKRNDSRAVQVSPKANPAAPKSAAANSPDVAPQPAALPAQAAVHAPAPAEQPAPAAPKAAEKPQTEQPAAADNAGAKFTVQVGSHRDLSEANEQVSRLRAAGFEARVVAAELHGRGTWYRVQVGRFADRAEATKAAGQVSAKGAAAGAIVAPLQN